MTETYAHLDRKDPLAAPGLALIAFAPALAAMTHPFALMIFHALVGSAGTTPSALSILGAAVALSVSFAIPVLGMAVACRPGIPTSLRRLAFASVLAPTLYVFVGVVQGMVGSPVADEWVWGVLWLSAMGWAYSSRTRKPSIAGRLRGGVSDARAQLPR